MASAKRISKWSSSFIFKGVAVQYESKCVWKDWWRRAPGLNGSPMEASSSRRGAAEAQTWVSCPPTPVTGPSTENLHQSPATTWNLARAMYWLWAAWCEGMPGGVTWYWMARQVVQPRSHFFRHHLFANILLTYVRVFVKIQKCGESSIKHVITNHTGSSTLVWPFLLDPGTPGVRSLGPDVRMSVTESNTFVKLNWVDSGWWWYQPNTNW